MLQRELCQELVDKIDCDAYVKFEAEKKCKTWYKNNQYDDGAHERQLAQDDCTEFEIGQTRNGQC